MPQTVKKASQSSPKLRRIESKNVFDRGVYVGENTSQAASVRVVRQRRTRSARSRLQNTGGKPRKGFFDKLKRRLRKQAAFAYTVKFWIHLPCFSMMAPRAHFSRSVDRQMANRGIIERFVKRLKQKARGTQQTHTKQLSNRKVTMV